MSDMKFFPLSKGAATRITPGTTVFYESDGTMLPDIFVKYDPKLGFVELKDQPAVKLDDLYTTCATNDHLPEGYIFGHDDLYEMMPGGKYTLEKIMPRLCEHCKPNKSCKKCPIRRIMDMLTGAYNFYEDAVASSYGGYWVDDEAPPRGKYQSKAPAISKEIAEKLVNAACTYCPGRKLTDKEKDAADMNIIYGGFGNFPGEGCAKCPLYIHCKHNF